jgi:hypothetical protein
LTRDFPIPQVQENGDYFVGFCDHKDEIHSGNYYKISTPKYGMLFRPRANGKDTLYIGPCDEEGLPSTDIEA